MTTPITTRAAQDTLTAAVQARTQSNTSMQFKTRWLKQHRSSGAIQQMQTDAIIDLADAVQQIQLAMSNLPLMLPPVSAARDAAANTTMSATTPFKRF